MKQHSRYQTARHLLIFWTLFVAIGAVGGALGMLLDPSGKRMGMDTMLPYFQILPFAEIVFQDFTFSGCALLIVNGYNTLPLDQRTEEVFPDQMLKYSTSREQTLITTTQLLCLFVEIQEHPDCKEERIQELLSTTGRYNRYTDYSEFITQ